MSSQEFTEWCAFAQLEPFGPLKDSHRIGTLAALLANINRTKKSTKTYRPDDFFPELPKATRQTQSAAEQAAVVKRIAAFASAAMKNRKE